MVRSSLRNLGPPWRGSGSSAEWDTHPEQEVADERHDRCHDPAGSPDGQVERQEDDPARGQGHQHEPGSRDVVGCRNEPRPSAASEQDAVVGDRRQDGRGRGDGPRQDQQVRRPLHVIQGCETVAERHRQQEPGQHLYAGLRGPQLLDQLGPVAVDRLWGDVVRGLVGLGRLH